MPSTITVSCLALNKKDTVPVKVLLPSRVPRPGFFNLGTISIVGQVSLCGAALSCALQYGQRHPWPLPPRYQYHPPS